MIKLIQLPVPDPGRAYTEGNIPLAAGYLAACVKVPVSIMPREIADRGGDAAVLKWILDDPPTVLGMTSFMWNVERNLWLSRRVKETIPQCRVVLGGPEMTADHPLIQTGIVDAVVVGEGERVFPRLPAEGVSHGSGPRVYRDRDPVPLEGVLNPYLAGTLKPRKGEILYLETMRGCPYGCEYCYYSKQYRDLRFFPPRQTRDVFRLARNTEVSEIYLMDPSFNLTPGLEERLRRIAKWNPEGIPLHSEVRLEAVTPAIAVAMRKAGFRSVEAGLQSTNPGALAEVNRSWDRERFLRGAGLLRDMDIRVQTGVIMGLPGDRVEDFMGTLDFLLAAGLAQDLELYPLSLLPGTRLRERAEAAGIRYQHLPPYQVMATRQMGLDDLKLAAAAAEDRLGIEFYPPVVPVFTNPVGGYREYLDLRFLGVTDLEGVFAHPENIASRLTLRFTMATPSGVLDSIADWLRRYTPHTMVQLVVESDTMLEGNWCRRLLERFRMGESYFDRLHLYLPREDESRAVRLFHLTADPILLENLVTRELEYDPVFRFLPGILPRVRDLLEERPALLIEAFADDGERNELKELYRGFEYMMVDVLEEVAGQ